MSPIHYPVSYLTTCLSPLLTTFGRNFPVTQLSRRPDRKMLGQADPLNRHFSWLYFLYSDLLRPGRNYYSTSRAGMQHIIVTESSELNEIVNPCSDCDKDRCRQFQGTTKN